MKSRTAAATIAAAALLGWGGCYALRPSSGGSQFGQAAEREFNPADIATPEGYTVELAASGLTFPTGAAFDGQGKLHVVEAGYSYGEAWATPRLARVEGPGQVRTVATGERNGPWTGAVFHDGAFFVAEGGVLEGGRILRISTNGEARAIVEGLPSHGDHHTDGPAASNDGWIYFGQGTASNSGVVGEDNARFGWLKRKPEFHDVPGQEIRLAGENFTTRGGIRTGAFSRYGTGTEAGQKVAGAVKCSGGILRVRPDGTGLELVAWGFRNPFGMAFDSAGELYVTDNGYDERGSRPVWGAADLLWRVQPGVWHGWPDFSGDEPLTLKKFKAPGKPQPKFLLAEHPNPPPPPVARFGVHSAATGLDFSRNAEFGHVGDAFVALLGDEAPAVGKTLQPVGFKVVRVDVRRGVVEDFAVNAGPKAGPASLLSRGGKKHGGLERPICAKFDPSGKALYVVDFGVMLHDRQGARPQKGTGAVWKITRKGAR